MAARISMDTDTWWHLRAGNWIVENQTIPTMDYFSYTRLGQLWQYPGWLVEVPMYWIYSAFGPGGMNLWTAFMVALTFIFIWHTLDGDPFLRAFVIILAAAASGVYWAARPYLVTFLFSAIYLWILEGYRWKGEAGGKYKLWCLPLFMIIWANSHGGFAVGFILWGVYIVGELWRILILTKEKRKESSLISPVDLKRCILLFLIGLAMVVAVCINPYGWWMLVYPFKTVGIGVLHDFIQEWQTPDFHSISVQPFIWLLFLTLGVIGASRRRLALTDFLLVAGFGYLGLMAGRNLALFSLVTSPVVVRHATPLFQEIGTSLGIKFSIPVPTPRWQSKLNLVILILLAIAVLFKVSMIYPEKVNTKVFSDTLPVDAVKFIKEYRPQGKMFNSYNWGGYLLWELQEYPVFVDGRTDLYNDEVINEWIQVVQAKEGWMDVLDHWGVGFVLLEPDRPVVQVLLSEGWNMLYKDKLSIVISK